MNNEQLAMMEGWKTDKLMNVVSSITTGKLDANAMVPNGQYRFYTCAKEHYYIDEYAFDDEALLISGNGEYVGYIHYYKGKFNAYQRVYVLTGFKVDVKYLQSYLNRYLPIRINKEVSQNNIPYIRLSTLSKMDIRFPESLAEQSAIAAMLSKVDEAIAAVQGSIAAAERLKKSLMQNLLTGRMKPNGTLRKDDEFYVDEKFGKVPVGWEVKKVKDICLNSGDYGANASAIDYDETKPRFIRITDIDDFGQLLDEGKASMAGDNTTKYMLEEDDFLFARTGDTVGKSLLYKKEMGPAVYAGYLIKFTFDKNLVLPDYFDLIAKSEFFEAFKISMKRVGAKPNINSREYCSFKFLLPTNLEEQKEIFDRFAHIDKTQKEKQNKIATLERLKKSLMQNLLTGKVRVKNK
ncbi:MAG: restriction endonuclease subunit S [Bacteroidales bacterium]|nr:restriction endonuclease subunit S [Bacteroidales bacterium]